MKKFLIPSVAVALLSLGSAPAFAGPYVGAGAGVFTLNDGASAKKSTGGGYLKVGHDFHEYMGAEVRGGLSGSTKEENVVTPVPANKIDFFVAALLKPQYHFNEQFMAYGLVGGGLINATQTPAGGGLKKDKSKFGAAYGVGATLRVMDEFYLGVEWLHIGSKPKPTAATFDGLSADMYTASIEYRFY